MAAELIRRIYETLKGRGLFAGLSYFKPPQLTREVRTALFAPPKPFRLAHEVERIQSRGNSDD